MEFLPGRRVTSNASNFAEGPIPKRLPNEDARMNACEKQTADLMMYLDDELVGGKLMEFLAHLKICVDCRAGLAEQLALSAVLRRSRPLYSVTPKLRARVAASLVSARAATAPHQVRAGSGQVLRRTLQGVEWLMPRWNVLIPAVAAMMLCFLLVSNVVHQVRASEYVDAALTTHRDYLNGQLPLQIRSNSPQVVTEWLARKVAFPFRLPDPQLQSGGRLAYRLLGARVVDYRRKCCL